jgi:hypothetical protein
MLGLELLTLFRVETSDCIVTTEPLKCTNYLAKQSCKMYKNIQCVRLMLSCKRLVGVLYVLIHFTAIFPFKVSIVFSIIGKTAIFEP